MQLISKTALRAAAAFHGRTVRPGTLIAAALFALASAFAADAAAQSVSTSGQIRGRILSAEGGPVPGVVLTATNAETGFQRTALSGEDGTFTVRLLPPGIYDLATDVIGFRGETRTGLRVVIGQSSIANFELQTSAVEVAGIEVTAEREAIDVADGGVTQFVSEQEIEELPSLGRDFVDFINLSGLVAPDQGTTTGGQFAIGGQRSSQTSVQIDGVDANNAFFGENRGGSRIPFVFSLESIREFQIITNGFDVEYGNFSGGIVNVVTRGGTNDWEGTLFANFRDDALTADPFTNPEDDPELTTEFEVQQFAGRLSGPIVEDKIHFLVSVDGQRRREPQLPLTQNRFAPGAERENPVLFEQVGEAFQILEQQYGVQGAASGYRPFSTSNDAITVFGRVDWTLNQDHRLSFRHNYSTFSNDNEWNGNFDFDYGLSRAETLEDDSHSFVTELQSVLGDNSFNVFRFQFADEKRPRQGKDLRPTLTVNLPGGQRVRYGGTFAAFNNNLEETKYQFINNFTHVAGDHTIKLGANALYTDIFNQFQSPGSQNQGAGEYIFNSIEDFEAFRPSSYFRPFQQGGGIANSPFSVFEWAAYVQDEWRASPQLTATLGLRYDQQSFQDSPEPVVDVERAFGFRTGFAPTDNNNISPRLALAYDMRGDGSSVIRGGAGYFYGRVPFVLGGNVLQTELPIVEVLCTGSIIDGDPDAPPSPMGFQNWAIDGADNPTGCAGDIEASGVPTYTFWQEDFEYPETFKANLGYETLVGDNSQISLDLLFSTSTNLYTVRNLNLREVQFTLPGEGERMVFTPASQFDPTSAASAPSQVSTDFGQVLVNYNDGRAQAFTAALDGAHRFTDAFQLRGSYTYTRAYDNSNYSCCTASGGFSDPLVGAFGPNDIGGAGDFDKAWGRTDFARTHTLILSGSADLPWGLGVSGIWRSQSGRPWTPAVGGNINGDGVRFNDRPFIFAPDDLPLQATGDAATEQRETYRQILAEHSCVGDHVGEILERNTCTFPWQHQLDLRLTKGFDTVRGQRAEIQVDFFNVLNGLGRLFCDEAAEDVDLTSGSCGLGRVTGVFGSDQNLLEARGYDAAGNRVLYEVGDSFYTEDVLGSNLVLQFQTQIGIKYFF
ncbi:MAG TPA: TonB-dependent receptor [Gemmatimonadota bacterium]|nr:TonB-dependent receptor [Gemmatimonadota bacterium]